MDRQVQIEVSSINNDVAVQETAVNQLAEFQLALIGGGIGDTVL